MTNQESKHILILGSKPLSDLPAVNPKLIITANGAAMLASYYRISDKNLLHHAIIASGQLNNLDVVTNVKNSMPSRLIVRKSINDVSGDLYGIGREANKIYSDIEQLNLQKAYLGLWPYVDLFAEKSLKNKIRRICSWSLGRYVPFGVSTGLWALIYALHVRAPNDEIIVAGIGLNPGGHFYGRGSFQSETAMKDRFLCRFLHKHMRLVSTTDDCLSAALRVRTWSGAILAKTGDVKNEKS